MSFPQGRQVQQSDMVIDEDHTEEYRSSFRLVRHFSLILGKVGIFDFPWRQSEGGMEGMFLAAVS
jgi:hypothetical protein